MPKCRACPAQVWWVRTEANKPMPLNPTPCDDGNVVILTRPPQSASIVVHVLHRDETPDPNVSRYKAHFATCPGRKKRKK